MKMIADKLEPIRAFEKQSGLARLLLFLYLEGPGNMFWMIDGSNIYPKSDRIVFQTIWQMNLAHQRSTVQSVSPLKSESNVSRRSPNRLAEARIIPSIMPNLAFLWRLRCLNSEALRQMSILSGITPAIS